MRGTSDPTLGTFETPALLHPSKKGQTRSHLRALGPNAASTPQTRKKRTLRPITAASMKAGKVTPRIPEPMETSLKGVGSTEQARANIQKFSVRSCPTV